MTPETTFKSPRGRPFLTVTIGDGTSPSPVSAGKVPYLADTITPKTRRVSRLPANEVCRDPSLICSFRLGHLAYLCQRSVADRQAFLLERLLMHAAAVMQRKHALDLACRCVEDAYQAREGPALQHAAHFRAFG